MTLTKKMLAGVLGLLVLTFIATTLITLNNSRNYFIEQMNSNAQDTATSLGLVLSQAFLNKDKATMLSMVEAVFDRGYFAMIEVRGLHGKLLVSRYTQREAVGVPAFFINLIQWPAEVQSSAVMRGWNQTGVVLVKSDTSYALSALWHNTLQLFYWYLLFGLILILSTLYFIKWLLQPLHRMTKQAEAICKQEYVIETLIPKTLELKKLTLTMNQMANHVKDLLNGSSG